jgi:hypothetical protein
MKPIRSEKEAELEERAKGLEEKRVTEGLTSSRATDRRKEQMKDWQPSSQYPGEVIRT